MSEEQTTDPTTFKFDWHALDRINWSGTDNEHFDEFLSWFLVHLVVPTEEHERTDWYDELSEKTNKFHNVELRILINGVEGNVQHMLESLHANMVSVAQRAAVDELRATSELRNLKRSMRALEGAVIDRLETVARGFGLTLREDEDD
jgi:hypothetical protein